MEAIYNDVGKCRFECAQELNVAKGNCLDMIKGMEQWLKDEYITPEIQYRLMTCRMKKTPKGVALVMSPFNYPAYLPYWPLVGNIAAGR